MVIAGAEFFNNNHMYLVTVCMGLVAFSDCERFYAVRPRAGLPDAWPRWMMRIQLSVVYGYAGLQKVNSEFLSGDALNGYMSMAIGPLAPVAHALTGTALVQPMAYSVVLVELAMALLVWWKRTRPIAFGVALPLHLAMLLVAYNGIELYGIVLFAVLTFTLLGAWVDAVPARKAGRLGRQLQLLQALCRRRPAPRCLGRASLAGLERTVRLRRHRRNSRGRLAGPPTGRAGRPRSQRLRCRDGHPGGAAGRIPHRTVAGPTARRAYRREGIPPCRRAPDVRDRRRSASGEGSVAAGQGWAMRPTCVKTKAAPVQDSLPTATLITPVGCHWLTCASISRSPSSMLKSLVVIGPGPQMNRSNWPDS